MILSVADGFRQTKFNDPETYQTLCAGAENTEKIG